MPEKKFKDLFCFFLRTLAPVSLVLGLESFSPWPRKGLSSEELSVASDFFVFLASNLLSSTPPLALSYFTEYCIATGASPAGGGGNAPRFISCPPTAFFWEEEVAFFGRKKTLKFVISV